MAKSEEPGEPGQGKLLEGLADPLKMPATSPSSTPGRAGSPWARRLTIAGLFLLVLLLLTIGLAWVWVRHLLRASLPRLSGTIQVSGPLGKIQIDRDALGIPTIRTEYQVLGPGRPGWLPTQVSGKEVTSPPPPPLRTARESF